MRRGPALVFAGLVACSPDDPDAVAGSTEASADSTSHAGTVEPGVETTSDEAGSTTGAPADTGETSTSLSDSSGGSSESDGSSTGSPSEPSVVASRITDTNRAYDNMHGGWGPHLRAPMQASDGSLWFAYDGGPDVLSNTTINYATLTDGTWATVASQPHGGGIQQNAAHVMRGRFVLTYGIDTTSARLEECYFDTEDTSNAACNTITIGGPYSTPPNSNYVGAAIGPSDEVVVWFTVVGAAGGQGQFIYTYNYGGGWNGPVVSALPGYNDMAYVRAHFASPSQIQWLGQAYLGAYPNGSYAIGVDEVPFGDPVAFETLGPSAQPDESVRNAGDIWVDPQTADVHGLARVDGVMHYYFVPGGTQWSDHLQPVQSLEGITRARFVHAPGLPLAMAASGGGIEVRWAQAGAAIDWTAASVATVDIPSDGFDSPSAIYAMGPEYQSADVSGLHFAVCGQYGVGDHEIWHVAVDVTSRRP